MTEGRNSTISVSSELRKALKDLGKKGETYEDVLWRLLKHGTTTTTKK